MGSRKVQVCSGVLKVEGGRGGEEYKWKVLFYRCSVYISRFFRDLLYCFLLDGEIEIQREKGQYQYIEYLEGGKVVLDIWELDMERREGVQQK